MNRVALVVVGVLGLMLTLVPRAWSQDVATIVAAPLVPSAHAPVRARGEARLVITRTYAELTIDVENLPFAQYLIRIGGAPRATILAMRDATGTNGQVEFREPLRAGSPLLNFNPQGQVIQIECGGIVFLSGVLGDAPPPEAPKAPTGFTPQSVKAKVFTTDPAIKISGSVQFKSGRKGASLVISTNGLALSEALLLANGVPIAQITPTKKKAKVVFATKPKRGQLPLDFDPSQTQLVIVQNGATVASALVLGKDMGNGARRLGVVESALAPTGVEWAREGGGRATFTSRQEGDRLEVEVEDVAPGVYDVLVDGVRVGGVTVAATPEQSADDDDEPISAGRVTFVPSPPPGVAGVEALWFEVRGATIQIAKGGVVGLGAAMAE